MRGSQTLRQLAVAAGLLQHALALPQAGTTADPAPVPWVTVDVTGSAETVTPRVITTQGHRATLSEAPSSIRSTATYTLSPSGHPSTYTGLAPVASATGTDGSLAGVFPACDAEANVGPVKPFCLPKPGSELHPGKTYYITWSPSYFPRPLPQPPQLLSLQVRYSDLTDPATVGFTIDALPASQGFYPFTIPPTFLSARGNPARFNMTFVLAYADDATPETNDLVTRVGPTVFVTPEGKEAWKGPNLVTIVLPIVLVGGFLLLSLLCFMSWRRTGKVPLLQGVAGRVRRRSTGGGYGVRQSRSQRVGGDVRAGAGDGAGVGGAAGAGPWGGGVAGENKSETDVGIQLTDRDSWSPTARGAGPAEGGGRNVFREEVERQERMR